MNILNMINHNFTTFHPNIKLFLEDIFQKKQFNL
jgi:hypothetical protein